MRKTIASFLIAMAAMLAACGDGPAPSPEDAAAPPSQRGPRGCSLVFRRFNGQPTSGVISKSLDISDDPGLQFLMGTEVVGHDSGDLRIWLRFRNGSALAEKGAEGLYWAVVRLPDGYLHAIIEAYEAYGRCEGTSFVFGVR